MSSKSSSLDEAKRFSAIDDGPVEAALAEYFQRRDRGESVDLTQLIAAHPGCEAGLRQFLGQERRLNGVVGEVLPPTAPRQENLAGRMLGDFRLVRIIGRGGMGVVWEAEQVSLCRRVAVKLLPAAMCADPRHRARFQNEARILAQLEHPHIVNVIAVGEEADTYYFAMQYVDGITADELIQRWNDEAGGNASETPVAGQLSDTVESGQVENPSPSPSPEYRGGERKWPGYGAGKLMSWIIASSSGCERYRMCARIAAEVADGLAHAHACGVLHRDVKPSNILLDASGVARLTDFGLARMYGDATLTATGAVLGTLRYASPEQLRGAASGVDERSDVYSLGVTLWELVTGKRLFLADDQNSVVSRVLNVEAPRPSSCDQRVPRDLETVVARAMAKEPADRYASAQALADDLRRFLAGKPIQAKPVSLVERGFRWANRNRALTTATIGSLVTLAMVALLASALVLRANSRTATALETSQLNEDRARKSAAAAQASERKTRELHYAADMASAGAAWHRRDVPAVREMLDRYTKPRTRADGSLEEDLRGFEWYFLDRQTRTPTSSLLYENKEPLYLVQFMPSGKEFLTSGKDGIVRWHDSGTGKVARSLESKQGEVNCVSYNRSRTQFATAGEDGTVKIWNAADLSLLHSLQAQNESCFWAKFLDDERLVAGGYTGTIQLIDTATGQIVREYETSEAKSAASEKPRSWNAYIGKTDNEFWTTANSKKGTYRGVHQWNVQTGDARKVSNDSALCNIVLDVSEKFLFINTHHGVRILEANSGNELWSYYIDNQSEAMILSPDERRLVVSDRAGYVYVWDVDLTNPAKIVPAENPDVFPIQKNAVFSMGFTPDGDALITVGTDGGVRRTIVEPKQPFREVAVNTWKQASVQPRSGTERIIVVPNEPLRFNQPKVDGMPQRFSLSHYPPNAAVSDETLVASYAYGYLGIIKLATGEVVSKLKFDRVSMGRPELSPDASQLAIVSRDNVSQRLDVLTLASKNWECYTSKAEPEWARFCVDDGLVTWVRKSQLVCFNTRDKNVRWQTKPNEVPGGPKARISLDGKLLMTINGQDFALLDCTSGKIIYGARCEHPINTLAFSADGRSFVTDGPQGQLSVWHTATGQRLFPIASLGSPTFSIHPLDNGFLAEIAREKDGQKEFAWYEF